MSQDLRDYELLRVDNRHSDRPEEATRMSITATVGPTDDTTDDPRGIQITLETEAGYAYGRVSEAQVRDLIRVLETRVNPDAPFEATGWKADRLLVEPNGEVSSRIP